MKLAIPEKVLDQHVVVLGKTGSGKSSALRHVVEHLMRHNKRVCVVDPKGDWWGLKLAADGKSPGLPVILFGDFKNPDARDVPINDRSGKHIAELVSDGNRPCIIGLRGWTQGAMTRFWIDFASTLFARNAGELYLVADEFHNFAPKGKILSPEAGQSLHWSNRLLSEGRGLGIVCLTASQRPQKVHNDSLTSHETLVAMRVIHKADRDAIKDWIDGNGDPELGKEVLNTLASMPRGEAWVWSPEIGFGPKRVVFPMFETFDSFAPPQLQKRVSTKGWADVDLSAVREKLAAVIEEEKANDPKLLKAELTRLRAELAKKPTPFHAEPKVVEVPVLKNGQLDRTEKIAARLEKFVGQTTEKIGSLVGSVTSEVAELRRLIAPAASPRPVAPVRPVARVPVVRREVVQREPSESDGELSNTEQAILDTIATLNLRGVTPTRDSVARWLAIHPNGGRYGTNLARLRADGYLDGFELTDKGNQQARAKATGVDAAMAALPDNTKRQIVQKALDAGRPLSRDELAEALGIHPNGGRFGTDLAWLRTMGVIPERGEIKPTEALLR